MHVRVPPSRSASVVSWSRRPAGWRTLSCPSPVRRARGRAGTGRLGPLRPKGTERSTAERGNVAFGRSPLPVVASIDDAVDQRKLQRERRRDRLVESQQASVERGEALLRPFRAPRHETAKAGSVAPPARFELAAMAAAPWPPGRSPTPWAPLSPRRSVRLCSQIRPRQPHLDAPPAQSHFAIATRDNSADAGLLSPRLRRMCWDI